MAERIQKLHKEVLDHLIKNATYEEEKDKKRREVSFQVSDLVIGSFKDEKVPSWNLRQTKG